MRSISGAWRCWLLCAHFARLRSGKVEFGTQLSGESKGTFGRGSWSAHRESGVPIWLFIWSRRGSDRDILNIVPFGMLPKFAHDQSLQLGGAFLFLHAFLFRHHEWCRCIGRATEAGSDAVNVNVRSCSASRAIGSHVRRQKGPASSPGPNFYAQQKAKGLTSAARPASQRASADWPGSVAG
jgi:hypothetical protein